MKRFITYLAFTLCIFAIHAVPYSASTLPEFGDDSRVSNPDGILKPATIDSINSMLLQIDKHRVQCVVVVVKNIENDDPYTFAIQIGRRFGVGGKKKQGVVMVLATDDRSYQIVTGDGMEKFLPDIVCSRIERHAMVPHLKKGEWDEAMMAGVRDMKGYIDQEPEIMEQYWGQDDEDSDAGALGVLGFLFFGGIGFIVLMVIRSHLNEKRCPHCKKRALRLIDRKEFQDREQNTHIYRTFVCDNCHNQVQRKQFIAHYTPSKSSRSSSKTFGGSSFGSSSHSSGGFSSLGGGTFGGGGAGGRF